MRYSPSTTRSAAANPCVDVALVDANGLERRAGHLRVEDGRGLPVVDLDVGGQQALAIVVSQQQDRLGDMADRARRQTGLIVVDQRDDVPARDVAVIDDGEAAGVEIEADRGNLAGRNRRPDGARVQQIRER